MPSIGIAIPGNVPDVQQDTALEFARRAEAAGVDSVWVLDRVVYHTPDPLVTLGALAAATTRVRIGASVLLAALRPPLLLAKMAATVDQLSGGRLLLGVGAGSKPDDFDAVELPFEHRGSRLEEALHLLKLAWSGQPVRFRGRFYDIDVGPVGPRPVQQPHPPIWMGGFADSVLRRVARCADGYIGHGDPPSFRRCWEQVRRYAEVAGRDPDGITPAALVHACVDPDRDRAVALAIKHFGAYWGPERAHVPPGSMIGPADECLEAAREYLDAGAETVVIASVTADLAYYDRLLEDVVPRLRQG
jgi:probable F420-dependent oxidoreductase